MRQSCVCRAAAAAVVWSLIFAPVAQACTLWAASGDAVRGGGTLLVKNRDWAPDNDQTVDVVTPAKGYRYLALIAHDPPVGKGKAKTRVVAGMNEKGLVVVNASADAVPKAERLAMPSNQRLMRTLLAESDSVDGALANPGAFLGPRFLMLADAKKVAIVEIGGEGQYSVSVKENGVVTHTNHYLDPAMSQWNKRLGTSSTIRHQRIDALLHDTKGPFTLESFIALSKDSADGPDNSIFRTGSTPKKNRTLAVFAVSIPRSGEPELYVRLLTEGKPEEVKRYKASELFAKGL